MSPTRGRSRSASTGSSAPIKISTGRRPSADTRAGAASAPSPPQAMPNVNSTPNTRPRLRSAARRWISVKPETSSRALPTPITDIAISATAAFGTRPITAIGIPHRASASAKGRPSRRRAVRPTAYTPPAMPPMPIAATSQPTPLLPSSTSSNDTVTNSTPNTPRTSNWATKHPTTIAESWLFLSSCKPPVSARRGLCCERRTTQTGRPRRRSSPPRAGHRCRRPKRRR